MSVDRRRFHAFVTQELLQGCERTVVGLQTFHVPERFSLRGDAPAGFPARRLYNGGRPCRDVGRLGESDSLLPATEEGGRRGRGTALSPGIRSPQLNGGPNAPQAASGNERKLDPVCQGVYAGADRESYLPEDYVCQAQPLHRGSRAA